MRNQTQHLPTEQLADFVEGRLAPADVRHVEEHLASGCPTCQADLAWLRETLALMAGDDWVQPPATVRAAVQRAYRQQSRPAPTSVLAEWLRGLFPRPVQLAMAFATVLVLLIAGGLIFQRWRGGSVVQTATLTSVSELGEVQPAGSNAWKLASSGTIIRSGDRIRTSESSHAVLVFPDKSATWLGSETDIRLTALTYRRDDGRKVIALHQAMGQTYSHVLSLPSPDSRFEIETPAAVITVRGTQFAVEVAASGVTRVTVANGHVAVTAQGITVEVGAGQATTVEPGQPPAPAVPAPTPVAPEMPNLPSAPAATQTPGPRPITGATAQPASTEAPEPSATPAPIQTSRPAAVTQPTGARPPTETPRPTRTEHPQQEPSETPKPRRTERPTRTPEPTRTEEPTEVPTPSKTREPTEVPEPTKTEEPTRTPEPPITAEPSRTLNPTHTEEPARTPEPTRTHEPTRTSEPTRTQEPTRTSEPTRTERPTTIPEPTRTEEPTEVPEPTETEPAANSAGQARLPGATTPAKTPDARDNGPRTGDQGNDANLLVIAMLAATVAGVVLLQQPQE